MLSSAIGKWKNEQSYILPRLDRSLARYAKSQGSDDDDDDEDITVDDDDWRAFRAKLVMGEKNTAEEDGLYSSAQTSNIDEKTDSSSSDGRIDDDLDGIGSIFRDEFVDAVESESKEETKKNEFTPLDPSQWAYDSGDVIEQGAVILGGIEQEFGFGLRQQYFH